MFGGKGTKSKRGKCRLIALLVTIVTACHLCTACRTGEPVPPQASEVLSVLSGSLIMECLDAELGIYRLALEERDQVSPIVNDCEDRCFEASLSSDGTSMLYIDSLLNGDSIWQTTLKDIQPQVLLQDEREKRFPMWSFDGSKIAYLVSRDPYTPTGGTIPVYPHTTLHVLYLTTNDEIQLTPLDGNVLAFDWEPNGEHIVISARLKDVNGDNGVDFDDPAQLYLVTLSDQTITPIKAALTQSPMLHPSWSADGHYIAYDSKNSLIVVEAFTGEEVARLEEFSPVHAYSWSPEEAQIAYIGYSQYPDKIDLYDNLFVFDITKEEQVRLTDTAAYTAGPYDYQEIRFNHPTWSPDGQYISFMWQTQNDNHIVVTSADGSQLTWVAEVEQCHRLVGWAP